MATTNHSPLDRYMVTEKYIVTRGTALHFPPKIFGKLVTSKDTIYGVVVDMPMSPTLLGTLVMYINGAANLYFNNGAEYIGAAQKYQTVAQPARIAVASAPRLLPEAVKTMLRAGEIEMGHARALLSLPEEQQVWLAQQIKEKGLSVRQTEEYVARYKERENTSENPHKTAQKSSEFIKFENELSKILNTDVKLVSNSKGRGNLQISFKNEKEFAAILDLLRSISNK